MLYKLLVKQVEKKVTFTVKEAEDLQTKFDVFLLANRITQEEYKTLTDSLVAKTEKATV